VLGISSRLEGVFLYADVVVHYSTCALIQRATSLDNSTFSQECLESSRAALTAHMRSNTKFNTGEKTELWAGYVQWSILQVCPVPKNSDDVPQRFQHTNVITGSTHPVRRPLKLHTYALI
jgi:hypothetical protein